jgi:hypothetical protein
MTVPFISRRYVGAVVESEVDEPYEEKMRRLAPQPRDRMALFTGGRR